jgi:hypothetical protein
MFSAGAYWRCVHGELASLQVHHVPGVNSKDPVFLSFLQKVECKHRWLVALDNVAFWTIYRTYGRRHAKFAILLLSGASFSDESSLASSIDTDARIRTYTSVIQS